MEMPPYSVGQWWFYNVLITENFLPELGPLCPPETEQTSVGESTKEAIYDRNHFPIPLLVPTPTFET